MKLFTDRTSRYAAYLQKKRHARAVFRLQKAFSLNATPTPAALDVDFSSLWCQGPPSNLLTRKVWLIKWWQPEKVQGELAKRVFEESGCVLQEWPPLTLALGVLKSKLPTQTQKAAKHINIPSVFECGNPSCVERNLSVFCCYRAGPGFSHLVQGIPRKGRQTPGFGPKDVHEFFPKIAL